jgi:hypothetical protein
VNPAWRDKSSWGFFDKQQAHAQTRILDRYTTTYTLDQFVVRGIKLSLLKAWPNDWHVFFTPMPYDTIKKGDSTCSDNNSASNNHNGPELLGTFPERPTYQELDDAILHRLSVSN